MARSEKTKVLFMLPALSAGGAERILITLMNNLNRDDFTPEFVALNHEGIIRDWIADDVCVHSFDRSFFKNSFFQLIALVRKTQPDIIFTTMVHSNAVALILKILFPRIRVIVREASLPSAILNEYSLKGRLCWFIYKMLYPRADLVLSNCSQVIEQFRSQVKISTHNHALLFNPVDTDRLTANMPAIFDHFDDRGSTVCFVCVGRLSYEKGYDRLIHALAAFEPRAQWRLDIIGAGDFEGALTQIIAEHGLQDHITLHGYHSQPWHIAAQADCPFAAVPVGGDAECCFRGFELRGSVHCDAGGWGIVDIAQYTKDGDLQIVDTMDDFVAAMRDVKVQPKQAMADSLLPSAFSLPEIMAQFEGLLRANP